MKRTDKDMIAAAVVALAVAGAAVFGNWGDATGMVLGLGMAATAGAALFVAAG